MSVKWITWAWEQDCGSAGEKLTLIALADHAGEDGTAFPSAGRLAEKTGQGESTIRRHLDSLEAGEKLTRVRRVRPDGKLSTYTYSLIHRSDRAVEVLDLSGGPALTGERAEPSVVEPSYEPTPLPPASGGAIEDEFADFWSGYPRKTGKPAASRAFRAARKKADYSTLFHGLCRWVKHWNATGTMTQFIPHPSTWLNQERWNDDCPQSNAHAVSPRERGRAALEQLARRDG